MSQAEEAKITPLEELREKLQSYASSTDTNWAAITLSDNEMAILRNFIKDHSPQKNPPTNCNIVLGGPIYSFGINNYLTVNNDQIYFSNNEGKNVLITNHINTNLNDCNYTVAFEYGIDYDELTPIFENWTYSCPKFGTALLQKWDSGNVVHTITLNFPPNDELYNTFEYVPKVLYWNENENSSVIRLGKKLVCIINGDISYINNVDNVLSDIIGKSNMLYYVSGNEVHIRCLSTGDDIIVANDFKEGLCAYFNNTKAIYMNTNFKMVWILSYFDNKGNFINDIDEQSWLQEWLDNGNLVV